MATYLVKNDYTLIRQEGDDCDFIPVVPAVFSMTGYTDVTFTVKGTNDELIFQKLNASITVAGQTITIPIAAIDTKGKNGKYRWELQITKGGKITTIGRGDFLITKEQIK
jgi:hypothetical protein